VASARAGLAVFTTGIFQVCAIPIYTLCSRHIDLRWLMMFGLAWFALSMWNLTPITHDWGARELLLPQALRGFAQQFAVALTLGGLPSARLKLAPGLFNLMRNLGGAIGIAACGTILNDRTNLHLLRVAEHLNPTNPAMVGLLRHTATVNSAASGDIVQGHAATLKLLWSLTIREAQTQAYADAFLAVMVCFVVTTAMVPLVLRVTAPAGPSADAH
jgi:DHA2 family multidrug resistance protein